MKLHDQELSALREAHAAVSRAHAVYVGLIADVGPVQPFPALRDAAACHLDTLEALFTRCGVPAPQRPACPRVRRYSTIPQAVAAAVAARAKSALPASGAPRFM